jgi:hypothetical protein
MQILFSYCVLREEKELDKQEDRKTKAINILSSFLATLLKFTLTLYLIFHS